MPNKFLITAFSKDRPGIVADITQVIYESGCSLENSEMVNLASEFAMIFLVSPLFSGNTTDVETVLATECRRLEREKGITAFIRPVSSVEANLTKEIYTKTIHVEGLDQAGIVYKVSKFLAVNEINIHTLKSEMISSPESGAPIYKMMLIAEIPTNISLSTVEKGLMNVGDQLNVDITIE